MPDNSVRNVLEAHQLSKEVSSPEGTLTILRDVSFRVAAGETVAVVGPSGAGKSTLLALLAGLDLPTRGHVDLSGANLTGAFSYKLSDNYTGSLSLVHHDDDTLAGSIETVSGPSFHLCNVYFEGARRIGDHYLWTGPREEAGYDGKQCQILLQPLDGAMKIDSLDCNYYCGARGQFDAAYQ